MTVQFLVNKFENKKPPPPDPVDLMNQENDKVETIEVVVEPKEGLEIKVEGETQVKINRSCLDFLLSRFRKKTN